ncbi:hypothetical protein LTS09_018249 [Friedmanniomyces endolithicus]|nr:hypothetical protein LTS09_018249 [Friedmanniomyces endolithicus]
MASPDLRDMLGKLCIDFGDEARFNCTKEWEIKSVVGFCHDSGEQKYKIAWQDSVLSKTDLMCRLVNNEWPLYRFARQITPEDRDLSFVSPGRRRGSPPTRSSPRQS